ncbi:MAG: fucose isomerase [Candidatus Latescibacteria bacterium]|nr:fucose isomerase [Candidatus Latescibacterota bacterium]
MPVDSPKVGILSFTDPRETAAFFSEREDYIQERHRKLRSYLEENGIEVADPLSEMRTAGGKYFGLRKMGEVEEAVRRLRSEQIEALVIGCWHWTEPMLPLYAVRELNLPVCLFTENDPTWAGATNISAVGASLWEAAANRHAVTHERILADRSALVKWVRGVTAIERLRRSSLLLWGGSYCLRMEHLQDDIPKLKSFLVGDILSEGQYILIRRAEKMPRSRVNGFLAWLNDNGVQISYDETMLTEPILRRQIALYLAARDRLQELGEERIVGVSVRCQPELSEEYGVTACLLPSFLPFGEDSEGRRPVVSAVCEGDIKGLLTCALLASISAGMPALFGDLKYVGKDYLIISNCGGSSVYYAGNSNRASEVLPYVRIEGQCQGAAGGSVGYDGQPGPLTVARLLRIRGRYFLQMGLGESLEITSQIRERIKWGQMWPHIAINLGVDPAKLTRVAGSNHYSAIPGNFTAELRYAAREAGIPVVPIDSDEGLEDFYHRVAEL